MSLQLAAAAAMSTGVLAYALFGGADFGSGFSDLTAGNSRRGAAHPGRPLHWGPYGKPTMSG